MRQNLDKKGGFVHQDIERILFSEDQLKCRVAELGSQISHDFEGTSLLAVCVLKGAVTFFADLMRCVKVPVDYDFIQLSSYGNAAMSSGSLDIVKDLSSAVEGRHVLLVEDIVDSGFTLSQYSKVLQERNAASVSVAALLRKECPNQLPVNCRYVGFSCANEFLVGYGLDYAQRYRNLPYIGVLKPQIYSS